MTRVNGIDLNELTNAKRDSILFENLLSKLDRTNKNIVVVEKITKLEALKFMKK